MIPLGGLRNLASSAFALPDVCSVQRGTETVTGDGTSVTWSTIATGIACRLSPSGVANERLGADASIQAIAPWRVTLPVGTDVTAKDRILIGSRTFEVHRAGERSYAVALTVLCSEVL